MGKKSRRRGRRRKNPGKVRRRTRHHNHFRARAYLRYKLWLNDDQLEGIIRLIRKRRSEKVKFVGVGKKRKGDFAYLVLFCGRVLPVVYCRDENTLITCLTLSRLLRESPKDQAKELKEWIKEREVGSL